MYAVPGSQKHSTNGIRKGWDFSLFPISGHTEKTKRSTEDAEHTDWVDETCDSQAVRGVQREYRI